MKYIFPPQSVLAGRLNIVLEDSRPGNYELLAENYFKSMTGFRERMEDKLGDLKIQDVRMTVDDSTRKFRDTILNPPSPGATVVFRSWIDGPSGKESCFYGLVDLDSVTEKEKAGDVEFIAHSHLRHLSTISIASLWSWLQSNSHERWKVLEWAGGWQYSGRAVPLTSVLQGMASLSKLAGVEYSQTWRYFEYRGGESVPFEKLWIVTADYPTQGGIRRGMFDDDLQRSPMSFFRYNNCLELLRYLQLSFFSYATVVYNTSADVANLVIKQRGGSLVPVAATGVLRDSEKTYETVTGIRIENEYATPPNDGFVSSRVTELGSVTQYTGWKHGLAWKSAEFVNSFTELNGYSYIHGEIVPVQDRGDLVMIRQVEPAGWPIFGQRFGSLHAALCNSYYEARGGRRAFYTRSYRGVRGTKGVGASIEHLRAVEPHSFVNTRGEVVLTEMQEVDVDVIKNRTTIKGLVQ